MKRLQTIVVALSLLQMFACGASEVKEVAAPTEMPIEQSSDEQVAELQPSDTTLMNTTAEVAPAPTPEQEQTVPIAHLLWLFVPAVAVAVLGYIIKRKMKSAATEKEVSTVKWLVGSELIIYAVELVIAAILLLVGILDACAEHIAPTISFLILFLSLNAYGAFVTNDAILQKLGISFSWKRVLIYVGIAFAVEALFAIFMPMVFDVAITDARMILPNIIMLCVVLCILFGVDMYKQNSQSLSAIPLVFMLFTIGVLMSGTLVLVALLVIGLWYVIRSCLVKEKAKEHRDATLATVKNEAPVLNEEQGSPIAEQQSDEAAKE